MEPHFERVAIIGVGLIGGSLGLALRERRLARTVAVYSRTPATRQRAVERGAADLAADSPEACVAGADLVYLATPVAAIVPTLARLVPHLRPGCLVTDAGSSKAEVVQQAEELALGQATFVGGHPMAGSADMGIEAARADLFDGMSYVVTPTARTLPEAADRVARLAAALGSRVYTMAPGDHDQTVAAVSHLPHLLAWSLMLLAEERRAAGQPVYELAAGSWSSATRVAAGGAQLWREILVSNRAAVLAAVADFETALGGLKVALRDDPELLQQALETARRLKLEHPGKP